MVELLSSNCRREIDKLKKKKKKEEETEAWSTSAHGGALSTTKKERIFQG